MQIRADGSGPRARRAEIAISAGVFVVALLAYLRTMRPTFGWGDSSELVTAAYHLGVGHSPGYPTWMLFMHPFSRIPIGDVAFRVNFMTALLGAVGAALLYLVYRIVSGSRLAGFVGALCFAFGATFWDVTTEAEVYTLHICFAAVVLLIVLRWRRAPSDGWLYLLALLIGVSLGNHALTSLMVPPIIYLVWAEKGWRFFTVRRVLAAAGLLVLGLSVYAYMPIRALANPPPHLNNPRTLADLWAQLTSPGAQSAMFESGIGVVLLRARHYLLLRPVLEFGYFGLALAAAGAVVLFRRDRRLAIFFCLIALLDAAYSANFNIFDIYIYYLPYYLVLAAFIAVGAGGALAMAGAGLARLARQGAARASVLGWAPGALLLALPFALFTGHLSLVDGSDDYGSERFARAVFAQVEPDCMILADWWTIAPLGYLKYIEGERQDVVMFAGPSIYADEGFVDFAQEDFLRRYAAVYFVEMLTHREELIREKWWLIPEGPVARVVMDRPEPESVLADVPAGAKVKFGDQVGLAKVEVEGEELSAGETLGVTLYWTALPEYGGRALEAILVLERMGPGAEEEAVHSRRVWQEKNLLGHDLYPLEDWRAGQVLRERHWIYMSDPAPAGEYGLFLRVREQGTADYLSCDLAGNGENARDYLVARIEMVEAGPLPTEARFPAIIALLRP